MGACTSKTKEDKENKATDRINSKKNDSNNEQLPSSTNPDKFANVPFIDSEEKVNVNTTTAPPRQSTENSVPPKKDQSGDNDEKTTVKTDFETNVSYTRAETTEKLKQEAYTFLRDKVFPFKEEKQKLIDYVHQHINDPTTDAAIVDENLEQCFNAIEKCQQPDSDENDKIKRRLMNMITLYVSSQSSDNSFLKALYDKLGTSLDLNSLNAETTEHEVVNVTVTKTVRQVFIDGSSKVLSNEHIQSTSELPNNVIHLANNNPNIPTDLPDDIRRKAEEVLNSFNDAIHTKPN